MTYNRIEVYNSVELVIPEWEWDSGVGVIFGAPFLKSVTVEKIRIRENDVTREWDRHTYWFRFGNGFRVSLWMDEAIQERIVSAVHWPQGDQVDYNTWMSPMELLELLDQVMGQQGLTA